jgi:ADP-ribosylglycohydrolase
MCDMLGAIAGDIIGSVFEHDPVKTVSFPLFSSHSRFTDDTVLTIAVAYAILRDGDYAAALKAFARNYPGAGYGMSFYRWMKAEEMKPYNSWGNGSAMRVSPVGFAFDSSEAVLKEAQRCAAVTHNHPEGIKGAQATALAIYLSRQGIDKADIRYELTTRFGYEVERRLAEIRPVYFFDVSCQGSVPESLIAFFESRNYEDAVRNAISLGGDADTMGCIAGAVAQSFYRKIPPKIVREARKRLPDEFLGVLDQFNSKFGIQY